MVEFPYYLMHAKHKKACPIHTTRMEIKFVHGLVVLTSAPGIMEKRVKWVWKEKIQ